MIFQRLSTTFDKHSRINDSIKALDNHKRCDELLLSTNCSPNYMRNFINSKLIKRITLLGECLRFRYQCQIELSLVKASKVRTLILSTIISKLFSKFLSKLEK